ncbi:MAG: hypothetical protein ACFB0B_15395 [Thermonemataceae bacterium]
MRLAESSTVVIRWLTANRQKAVGVFFCLLAIVVHNLHDILPHYVLEIEVRYYHTMFYFLYLATHSFSPAVTCLGLFLLFDKKNSLRLLAGGLCFFYLYKGIKKLPFRDQPRIHEEYLLLIILFFLGGVLVFHLATIISYNIQHKIRHSTATIKGVAKSDGLFTDKEKYEIIEREADNIEQVASNITQDNRWKNRKRRLKK